MIQNQGTTFKAVVKVPKWQVFGAQGKKIKDALNMLIRIPDESRRI